MSRSMSRSLFSLSESLAVAKALVAGVALMGAATSALAAPTGKEALATFNKDGDETLEIVEVIELGTQAFHAADANGDKSLQQGETKGHLSADDWAAVNKDGDEALELDEWLVIIRSRFNAADADKDGKLTASELDGAAGQKLLLILVK